MSVALLSLSAFPYLRSLLRSFSYAVMPYLPCLLELGMMGKGVYYALFNIQSSALGRDVQRLPHGAAQMKVVYVLSPPGV